MKKYINENIDEWIDSMDNFQLARWSALVEGVNLIYDKADEKQIKKKLYIKQPALKKYVDSTCDIICTSYNRKDSEEAVKRKIKEKGIINV